jgi:hypothetical protein
LLQANLCTTFKDFHLKCRVAVGVANTPPAGLILPSGSGQIERYSCRTAGGQCLPHAGFEAENRERRGK